MSEPTIGQLRVLTRLINNPSWVLFVHRDMRGRVYQGFVRNKMTLRGAIRLDMDETLALLKSGWIIPVPELLAARPYYYTISEAGRKIVEATQQQTKGGL